MPIIAPNVIAIQCPESGPAESTPAIAKPGINMTFMLVSSSLDRAVWRIDRLTKACSMQAAPTRAVLLTIAANQLDV